MSNKCKIGSVSNMRVIRVFDYGVWLTSDEMNCEVLVEIVELPGKRPIYSARKVATVGQVFEVEIINIDPGTDQCYGRINHV